MCTVTAPSVEKGTFTNSLLYLEATSLCGNKWPSTTGHFQSGLGRVVHICNSHISVSLEGPCASGFSIPSASSVPDRGRGTVYLVEQEDGQAAGERVEDCSLASLRGWDLEEGNEKRMNRTHVNVWQEYVGSGFGPLVQIGEFPRYKRLGVSWGDWCVSLSRQGGETLFSVVVWVRLQSNWPWPQEVKDSVCAFLRVQGHCPVFVLG